MQFLLVAVGTAAVMSGMTIVVLGSDGIPGASSANPSIDNLVRFLAIFWASYGGVLIWFASRVERYLGVVPRVVAPLFVGGVARLLSIRSVGLPHWFFVVAMSLELVGPPVVVAASRSLRRQLTVKAQTL